MQLTLKGTNKKNTAAIYAGSVRAIRFPLAAFANGVAPTTLQIDGDALLAQKEKAVREKKVKLTKEERAALPKPTLAERIAKRDAEIARKAEMNERDKAKLATATGGM